MCLLRILEVTLIVVLLCLFFLSKLTRLVVFIYVFSLVQWQFSHEVQVKAKTSRQKLGERFDIFSAMLDSQVGILLILYVVVLFFFFCIIFLFSSASSSLCAPSFTFWS